MSQTLSWCTFVILVSHQLSCSRVAAPRGEHESRPEQDAPSVPLRRAAPAAPALPRLQGPYRSVFKLADNRLLAHMLRYEGLVVPLGYPGSAKYLRFGRPRQTWAIDRRDGGQQVAVALHVVSWLDVPLTAAQAKSDRLVLRVKSAVDQSLRVAINDQTLKPTRLVAGWQTVEVGVPTGVLRGGENRIVLRWERFGRLAGEARAYAAVRWLAIGPRLSRMGDADPLADLDLLRDDALWLPRAGGLAYYIFPYRQAKLRLRFSAQPASTNCSLLTELDTQGKPPQQVSRRAPSDQVGVAETFVDLSAVAEQVTRLTLRAEGQSCSGIRLHEAEIVLPGTTPTVHRGARPKNVLFWLIDNARADRYRIYNPSSRVETPVIDQLGASGTVFEKPYIAGTESRVSHAALWTGMYPQQHGFIGPKDHLAKKWITLAEAIGKAGLTTAGWTANGNISEFWGFADGWQYFRNTLHDGGGLSAQALADHAIRFVRKQGGKPFFLYVGTIDPHVSWRAREPWLSRYDARPYRGKYVKTVWGKDWDRLARQPTSVSSRDRDRIRAIYDSTISYNDQQLGRLLAVLQETGIRDQTMVVITADHGEELWEHDRIGHGGSLRDTVVNVPLLIHYPPLFGSGVRVREGVDAQAILATILDALGAEIPDEVQTASLLPLAQGVGRGYPRPAFASQYELAHVMKLAHYKIWVGGKGDPQVYDTTSDPHEQLDIAAKRARVTRWLTDALATFLHYQSRWRQSRWGVPSNNLPRFPSDLERGTLPPEIRAR